MTNGTLNRRIKKLEGLLPKPTAPEVTSPVPEIKRILTEAGYTPVGQESWAEVLARYMGITLLELKIQVSAGAQ